MVRGMLPSSTSSIGQVGNRSCVLLGRRTVLVPPSDISGYPSCTCDLIYTSRRMAGFSRCSSGPASYCSYFPDPLLCAQDVRNCVAVPKHPTCNHLSDREQMLSPRSLVVPFLSPSLAGRVQLLK